MSDHWYALHVKPRFEKYVTTQLDSKGYETFLPTYVSKRKWSDRVKSLSLPLFPSYVFCRFDIHSRLPIVITPGVMAVLGAGKIPAPIDESELSAIRHITEAQVRAEPCPYLAVGEMVRVESGPLEGLVGIVLRTKGSDRLVVSVSLLMRSVSVEIDRSWVKPVREGTISRTAKILDQNLDDKLELVSAGQSRLS
jgi:transcription antitermination factor NusG